MAARLYYIKVQHNGTETVKAYRANNMTHAHTQALKEFQTQDAYARIVYCVPARNGM